MSDPIQSLSMPKWGMTMTEGTLVAWLVEQGDEITVGDEVAEVETEKMIGAVEAQISGVVRRRIAAEGDVIAVGGLLAVIAPADVREEDLDAFIERFASAGASPETAVEAPRSEAVDGAFGRVHGLATGDGPGAVVLLHGFGGNALNWRFNFEQLAREHSVLAIDLPGHGESTKNVGDGTADELMSAVWETLQARDVRRVHLVGHSLGGLVAAGLAVRFPDEVASLALLAPAGFGAEIDGDFIDGFVAASSRRELKRVLQMLVADAALVNRELIEDVLRYKRLDGVSEALGAIRDRLFAGGAQSVSTVGELAGLEAPLLVVWGSADRVIPSEQAAAAPHGARVEVIEGVGHSPHIEAAADVNVLLTEFLSVTEPVTNSS